MLPIELDELDPVEELLALGVCVADVEADELLLFVFEAPAPL